MQSLQTQGEIIAAAVAASATVDTNAISIDPEKLLKLAPGESASGAEGGSPLEFSLNPERVGPLLRRLVSPTRLRARIYDRDGFLLLNSRSVSGRSNILRFELPPAAGQPTTLDASSFLERSLEFVQRLSHRPELPLYEDIGMGGEAQQWLRSWDHSDPRGILLGFYDQADEVLGPLGLVTRARQRIGGWRNG